MNTIAIKKIAAKDIIPIISDEFQTDYEEAYGEYFLKIPSKFGRGRVSGINFPNGVGLFKFEVQFKESQCFNFCSKKIHPFKFMYVIEGEINHQFNDEEITHEIKSGQSVILGANYKSGNKILFPKRQKLQIIVLDIDRKKFVDQLTFPLSEMNEVYKNIFADTEARRTLYHHTQYSLKMEYLVNELNNFHAEGLEKVSYHGAKALELLTYMLMGYKDDTKSEDLQTLLKQKDLVRIKNVVNYIDRNISELGNISTLAENEGISEAKLREGFQILFNSSIHDYIQTRRLETAMQLLLKTDKSISEIVYAIGLNSRSHFSKIFKERYGVSPKTIRSKIDE
ncbi:AraC family transcriptional regulator [Gramella sp. BOM4]|nr:AraC family transcriptional regulator [Christiangramia bathymodioli]